MDTRIHQVGIGADQLFAAQCSNTSAFYSYIFNSTHFIVYYNKITYFKWLIKEDHKIIEQIAQNVLRCQRNRHTANAKTGNNRCNIIPKIIDQEHQRQDP